MIPLSVLDLATVVTGSSPAQALRETTMMAVEAERLGYRRFWVAEHHAMPAVASSAPAVLIPHLANGDAAYLAVGIVGATVMPHVIYLHSALTNGRVKTVNDAERRRVLRSERVDVIIALTLASMDLFARRRKAAALKTA